MTLDDPTIMASASFPGQMVLGCIRKLSVHELVSEPKNSILPQFLPLVTA